MKIKDRFIFSTSRLSIKDYFISLVTSERHFLAPTFPGRGGAARDRQEAFPPGLILPALSLRGAERVTEQPEGLSLLLYYGIRPTSGGC